MARLLQELEQERKEKASILPVPIDFGEHDDRLKLSTDDGAKQRYGTLNMGTVRENIVCVALEPEDMRPGQKGPRHVEIYRRISAGASVQPFYGIAARDNQLYAVMKDLRKAPSLAELIASETFPKTLAGRLSIAYDIVCAVAYLHKVEVLVKNLADNTILMIAKSKSLTPILCELEQARLVFFLGLLVALHMMLSLLAVSGANYVSSL